MATTMVCCPPWTCPRWSSAAVVYIEIVDGMAKIATKRMEQDGRSVTLAMSDDVKQAFAEKGITRDYGLVVSTSTKEHGGLLEAIITAFVSFYRDNHNPPKEREKRVNVEQALNDYERQLEGLKK